MTFETIETKRLILRLIDAQHMKQIFDELPEEAISQLLGHQSHEEFEKEQQKHLNNYSSYNRTFLLFLLIDKQSGNIIGRCGIHNWNKEHKRAEIGYVMHTEHFRRSGLMSEALQAVLEYAFITLQLNRVEALVSCSNIPSLKLLEKFGFTREGLLREHFFSGGNYEDSIIMGKLRKEHLKG